MPKKLGHRSFLVLKTSDKNTRTFRENLLQHSLLELCDVHVVVDCVFWANFVMSTLSDWNRFYRRTTRQALPVFQGSRDFTTEGLLSLWRQFGSWSLVWCSAGKFCSFPVYLCVWLHTLHSFTEYNSNLLVLFLFWGTGVVAAQSLDVGNVHQSINQQHLMLTTNIGTKM